MVDILDVAKCYGVEVGRNNMANCFLHEDQRPSLSIRNGHFKCFSCNAHGSVIDLVSILFAIKPEEAVKKINYDFNLWLNLEKPMTTLEIKKKQKDEKLYRGFWTWERRSWLTVSEYLLRLKDDIERYQPRSPYEQMDERYIKALHEIDYVDHIAWVFINGDFADKLAIFKNCRKEIERIEKIRTN